LGGLAYSARTDPYRIDEAHNAVHGIIPTGAKRGLSAPPRDRDLQHVEVRPSARL
jgi:hypothetical protein